MSVGRKKIKDIAVPVCIALALSLFAAACAAAVSCCSVFGVFDPKDLGVSYTEKDAEAALEKFNVVFHGDTDLTMLQKGECSVEAGETAMRTVSFTSAELTALAASFLGGAAEQQQLLIKENCRVVYSGKVYLAELFERMKVDASDTNLGPTGKLNISVELEFVLNDGQLALKITEMSLGMFENVAEEFFEKLPEGSDVLPLGIRTESVETEADFMTITAELPAEIAVTEKTP